MTLIRQERLNLLRKRRDELLGLVAAFEHKPDTEPFILALNGRVAEIDQLIADVEFHRA